MLTTAGDHGALIVASKGIGQNLLSALRTYGDPLVPVALARYAPKSFRLTAAIRTDAARSRPDVLATASAALTNAFSFQVRDLGQPVAPSEVLAVIQGVTGVVAATLTALWKFDPGAPTSVPTTPPDVLVAQSPQPGTDIGVVISTSLIGAELIVLDSAPITWTVLS